LAYSNAASGLQPTHGEALHLQVEPAIQPLVSTQQRDLGKQVTIEDQLEGVHASVADCRDGTPCNYAASGLRKGELVAREGRFLGDED
jgi:hypothetical protein